MSFKPVLDATSIEPIRSPVRGPVPTKEKWAFSFRFWDQTENFQVGGVKNSWFASLLERLAEMSRTDREEFLRDRVLKGGIRFHEINWNSKNIPISRNELTWVGTDYLHNEVDFPFYQFHVSKALGRVVGFFDERQIFNIVLLDPNHNIQPSDYNDYKIRPTVAGSCQFTQLLTVASEHVSLCESNGCSIKGNLVKALEVETLKATGGAVIFNVSSEHHDKLSRLIESGIVNSPHEILSFAIEQLDELIGPQQ